MSKLFKKTLILMVLLFGFTATVTSTYAGWVLYQRLIEEYKSKAIAITNNIARSSLDIFLNRDAATIQSIIDQFPEIEGVSYVVVAYEDGEIVSHTFAPQVPEAVLKLARTVPENKDEVTITTVDLDEKGDHLDVCSPILSGLAGYLHVGMSLAEVRSYLWATVIQLHLINFVIFLFAVVIAYLMINTISKPLTALTEYADRVAAKDFSSVVETHSRDEIGLLARTMTNMANEMRRLIAGLEQSVRDATQELQDTLAYVSAIIQNLADGLVVLDPDGKVTQHNPALERILELPEEPTGKDAHEILGEDAASFMREKRRVLALLSQKRLAAESTAVSRRKPDSTQKVTAEISVPRQDDGSFPIELTVSVVNLKGQWHSIGIVRDITQRKIAERALQASRQDLERRVQERTAELSQANAQLKQEIAERRRAEQDLRRAEEKYRSIFENAVEGIFQSTPEGRYIACNPAMAKLLGYESPDELISSITDIGTQLYVDPEQRREYVRRMREHKPVPRLAAQFYRRDGSILWASLRGRPIYGENKDLLYIEGFFQDITERKRTEEELLKMEKLESIGALAGGIAHDFNNLLTAILGNISVLKMSLNSSHNSADRLMEAEKACLRAKGLTNQLLAFSKGGAPIKRTVGVLDLIKDPVELPLRGTMVRATFDVPAEIWPVDVDVGQIGQVMSNLVINAQQAMSGAGTVSITAENVLLDERIAPKLTPGRYVSIAVADHGCGVSPDDLSRIFDLYYTTKPRGSGLGLATAFAIINNHNGLITVDSELGQGTTFRILLPASTSHVDEEEKPDDRPITGKGRILLMDDEEAIRDLAGDLLTLLGYQVEVSCEGSECVSMYQTKLAGGIPFDAVILDLTVPGGMGGCAAVERLREIDPQVRAIVSSGYSDDPVMANYREWGFVGVIPKPYDASEISQVLNTVLANPNAATD